MHMVNVNYILYKLRKKQTLTGKRNRGKHMYKLCHCGPPVTQWRSNSEAKARNATPLSQITLEPQPEYKALVALLHLQPKASTPSHGAYDSAFAALARRGGGAVAGGAEQREAHGAHGGDRD